MNRFGAHLPVGSWAFFIDALMIGWTAAWIGLGVAVASEVEGLANLSDTVVRVGGAVIESGRALQSLESLPLVGERVRAPADEIQAAGARAIESGRSSRESVENLSTLLGLAIGLIPSLPLLAFYLPLRLSLLRERRWLAMALREHGDDPAFREFLARRAETHLSLWQLRRVTDEPWRNLAEGTWEPLVDAELARFGLRRTRRRS